LIALLVSYLAYTKFNLGFNLHARFVFLKAVKINIFLLVKPVVMI
jgi:hypothetical protein